jgi:hypothetical protein
VRCVNKICFCLINNHESFLSILFDCFKKSDDSMKLLYDNGKGRIVTEAINWMRSSSEHLQNSGALAFGNMARSGMI